MRNPFRYFNSSPEIVEFAVDPDKYRIQMPAPWRRIPVKRLSGDESHATNNQMEFRAAIEASTWLDPNRPATIYSDSRLVVEILGGRWSAKKNLDLVTEARRLMRVKCLFPNYQELFKERCGFRVLASIDGQLP